MVQKDNWGIYFALQLDLVPGSLGKWDWEGSWPSRQGTKRAGSKIKEDAFPFPERSYGVSEAGCRMRSADPILPLVCRACDAAASGRQVCRKLRTIDVSLVRRMELLRLGSERLQVRVLSRRFVG